MILYGKRQWCRGCLHLSDSLRWINWKMLPYCESTEAFGLGKRHLPFIRLFLVNICYAIKNNCVVGKFLNPIYISLSININKKQRVISWIKNLRNKNKYNVLGIDSSLLSCNKLWINMEATRCFTSLLKLFIWITIFLIFSCSPSRKHELEISPFCVGFGFAMQLS